MRGMNRNLAVALLLISLSFPAISGAVDFTSPKSYPVGTSPWAVVIGDFNGDGKPDIAVANLISANVSILLGNGDGTFKAAVNSPAGPAPYALAIGDFNGDHKLDLIVISPGDATTGAPGVANILLGNGDGTFQPPLQIKAGQSPRSMAVGDLNGDKKLDLIIGDRDDESLSVLLGNGDGTFQTAKTIALGVTGNVNAILVADFNGDTIPDVAAATSAGVVSLLGHGDGTFQAPNHVASNADFLLAGEFNNSHKMDLVGRTRIPPPSGCHEFCLSPFAVTLFRGNGDGTFNPVVQVAASLDMSRNFVAADFNADNKLDLLITKGALTSGDLLLGEGNGGSFIQAAPIDSGMGANPVTGTIASADFNGDSLPDLVITDNSNNSVTILLNTSPSSGADLAVVVNPTVANPAFVGAVLSYTVTVFSEGPQDASGVILTENLPSGLKFASVQPSQGTCTGTNTISCNLGAMPDPSTASVQFTVTPMAAGTLTDALQVVATQPDLNLKNNSASIVVSAILPADLSVSAAASRTTGTVGDKVTVNVNIANSGPAAATNVTLADSTDTTQISNVTISTGSCTMNTAWMNCALGTLASGANVTMSYVVTLGTAGFAADTTVSSDESDQNPSNNVANLTIAVSDFTMSPAETSLAVKRGGQVSEVLTFGAQSGFAGSIALACSVNGPSPMPSCGISPASVTPGINATLTVNAAGQSASLTAPWFEHGAKLYTAAWLPLELLGCVLAMGLDKKRRRMWALCLMLLATILPVACGGGSSGPQQPHQPHQPHQPQVQTYTVTVAATSGAIQHSTAIIVTVD
jgi:uncharacterized repeat protein (TIGR01451 family)